MKMLALLLASVCGLAPMLCAQRSETPGVTLNAIATCEMLLSHPVFMANATCDDAGNIYTRLNDPKTMGGPYTFRTPVQEITPDTRLTRNFDATDAFSREAESRVFFPAATAGFMRWKVCVMHLTW